MKSKIKNYNSQIRIIAECLIEFSNNFRNSFLPISQESDIR